MIYKSYSKINTTFLNEPTTFEIKIDEELGWIYNVYLTVNGIVVSGAVWENRVIIKNIVYSIFTATYIPTELTPFDSFELAEFHFSVNDKKYDCEPLFFEVLC